MRREGNATDDENLEVVGHGRLRQVQLGEPMAGRAEHGLISRRSPGALVLLGEMHAEKEIVVVVDDDMLVLSRRRRRGRGRAWKAEDYFRRAGSCRERSRRV